MQDKNYAYSIQRAIALGDANSISSLKEEIDEKFDSILRKRKEGTDEIYKQEIFQLGRLKGMLDMLAYAKLANSKQ